MFDRGVLIQHLGDDPAFEREFLGLLLPTIRSCIESLENHSPDLYGVLHGAKPGILISCSPDLAQDFDRVCVWALENASKRAEGPGGTGLPAAHGRLLNGLMRMDEEVNRLLQGH